MSYWCQYLTATLFRGFVARAVIFLPFACISLVIANGCCCRAALAAELKETKARLDAARPTAVNLMWATGRVLETAEAAAALAGADRASVAAAVLHEALALAEEDVAINTAIAKHGAEIVPAGANILHHCNTGALATVDVGTALGVIYECHKQGKGIHVWVDETRPRLQGAKLTAWELMRGGVPLHLIVDSASGLLMRTGKVDVVLFGADRVAANGDVANKVGTYKVSIIRGNATSADCRMIVAFGRLRSSCRCVSRTCSCCLLHRFLIFSLNGPLPPPPRADVRGCPRERCAHLRLRAYLDHRSDHRHGR